MGAHHGGIEHLHQLRGLAHGRKRIEEGFGYIKTVAILRKTRHRGTARVGFMFTLAAAAYNLVRIPKLLAATPR